MALLHKNDALNFVQISIGIYVKLYINNAAKKNNKWLKNKKACGIMYKYKYKLRYFAIFHLHGLYIKEIAWKTSGFACAKWVP